MKTINLRRLMFTAIFTVAIAGTSFSQQGKINNKKNRCLPDLTEEQEKKIKEIKTEKQKVMLDYRNQLREKKAHLQTVSTGGKVDMNEVNKTIEEIGAVKISIAKNKAEVRQKIRNILTDEQRVQFDLHYGKRKMHKQHKHMRGQSNGHMKGQMRHRSGK